jgi:hypothetical protein
VTPAAYRSFLQTGKWAFFGFHAGEESAAAFPKSQSCYSCHASNGAVDNTFVQFYSTLLDIAKQKGTLKAVELGH